MADIEIKASYFWSEQPGDGEMCSHCKATITGKMYLPVMQLGNAIDLNFKDIDLPLCETCYLSIEGS